jgi:hypothetical protein
MSGGVPLRIHRDEQGLDRFSRRAELVDSCCVMACRSVGQMSGQCVCPK